MIVTILFVIAATGWMLLGLRSMRDPARARAASTFLRGARVAERMGCFGCHGPAGERGIPNPGGRGGETPAWVGGTYMMFNETPAEIREWIRDGAPKRLLADPSWIERRDRQLLRMPAYGDRLGAAELDDLVAYVTAVSAAEKPEVGTAAAEGRSLAVEHGCFGCHGSEGRGALENPGSFKGHIPPWDSSDYPDLVRSPEEFREWVASGEIRRFRNNPAAAHFLDAQVIKMPAFREHLNDSQIERIRSYVEWVRARAASAH